MINPFPRAKELYDEAVSRYRFPCGEFEELSVDEKLEWVRLALEENDGIKKGYL